jgi:hypothetical protein
LFARDLVNRLERWVWRWGIFGRAMYDIARGGWLLNPLGSAVTGEGLCNTDTVGGSGSREGVGGVFLCSEIIAKGELRKTRLVGTVVWSDLMIYLLLRNLTLTITLKRWQTACAACVICLLWAADEFLIESMKMSTNYRYTFLIESKLQYAITNFDFSETLCIAIWIY